MIAYRQRDVETLLDALPASVARLVIISSSDVYATYGAFLGLEHDPVEARPSTEEAALRTVMFPYRRHASGPDDPLFSYEKILVERAAMAWTGGATTILRLPMVYGANDRQRRVAGYLERLRASAGSLYLDPGDAAWRCTRGYVEDVAAAIALAARSEAAAGAVFNVGEREALSELEWARAIAAAAGWEGRIDVDPETPTILQTDWSPHLIVDTSRIRERLGYAEPCGRDVGLRRSVDCLVAS
jgi:nucleoside-diphosphate-sugar epimerase